MKEIDIFHRGVRRDPFTGDVAPTITCNANSKNRYNILAAVASISQMECQAQLRIRDY